MKPEPFYPMEYICKAIEAFFQETPDDALCILHAAREHQYRWLEHERFLVECENEDVISLEDHEGVVEEAVSKAMRRMGAKRDC